MNSNETVWLRMNRVVGQGHRTPTLDDLRSRSLRICRHEEVDVALVRCVRSPGGDCYGSLEFG